MVFSRFSQHLGGRVRLILVSSAGHIPKCKVFFFPPLTRLTVHRKFLSLIFCCKVEECYIRTESGIISTTHNQTGSAGIPLTNINIIPDKPNDKIGQIWVSGPNVTGVRKNYSKKLTHAKGQFANPNHNGEGGRFQDGWFNTLQIGCWNPDSTLTVLLPNLVIAHHNS